MKQINNTINLLEFCKNHEGAFALLFPPEWLGKVIMAVESGTINRRGFCNIINARLACLQSVGVIYE